MGFRINNNIPALISMGNLSKSQSGLQTSIERLSSGLRINRGADDAAGLTISEKLRGQIRGLNRAIMNAQDGISLIQTAEGALGEDASILNRLRELSIQSQADSLTTNDRLEIQKEVDQLVDEVDRISKTTEFNTKKLLDGSANALVSTTNNDLKGFQTGAAGTSAGDYQIVVRKEDSGSKQVQASQIMKDVETGKLASLGTKLQDLESFYDNDGNLVLFEPTTVTLRAGGEKTEVIISADMTLQEISSSMQDAITRDISDGGLGLKGSEFAYDSQKGQIFFTSGKDGQSGELAIATDESIIRALGFQITSEAKTAAFKLTATELGVDNAKTVSANTTSDIAKGVVSGLDLKFKLPSEARVDGRVPATEAIFVGPNDIVFTFHDTNATPVDQSLGSVTAGVTITLTANRTFSLASIQELVNDTVAVSNVPNSSTGLVGSNTNSALQVPGVTASFDGYNLVLTSSAKGSSGIISVAGNSYASELLGINTGKVTGNSGSNAILTSSTDISGGVEIGGTGIIRIRMADGDYHTNSKSLMDRISQGGDITFNKGVNISATSILDTFNSYFSVNNLQTKASLTSDGKLEFRSSETGEDAKISIWLESAGDSLANFGFVDGQSDRGLGGNAAVFIGATNSVAKAKGYTFSDHLRFSVTDRSGASSGTIQVGTEQVDVTGESFTISQNQLASLISESALKTTDVDFAFDAGGRLDFFSRSAGNDARVVLNVQAISDGAGGFLSNAAEQETVGRVAMGIDFSSAQIGAGTTDFILHVSDRALRFQVGANKSQHLQFEIVNTGAEALGLKGLDITNVRAATKALGDIDRAVNTISSERSKLGSLQNRMTSTIRNLSVTSTNLTATESLIRDVDVAKETIDFTRSQILIQAGTAQLAQARGLTQNAIQLLQG